MPDDLFPEPVSMSFTAAQLTDVLAGIERLAGVRFAVELGVDLNNALVTIQIQDEPLSSALELVLDQAGLHAEHHGDFIVISD